MFVEKVRGALRLAAMNAEACALGLTRGMTLADAQARTSGLRTLVHRPDADAALLIQVLEDFGRFTPMAATDGNDGVILDVTGCTHLFGEEAGMVRAVEARARRIGLNVRTALAGTPQAARAVVRFGRGGVIPTGQDRQVVRALPIAALERDDKDHQALTRAGLRTLGDLDDRPTAPLAARFGTDLPVQLMRILGQEDVRITPLRPPAPCIVDRILFEPITETTDVEAVISDLLTEAVVWLEQRSLGGRAFEVAFFRIDGATRRITVRTGRATRDAAAVIRLFKERLAALATPLDPGFGFDQLRLSVPVTQVIAPMQSGFEAKPIGNDDLDRLIDRLTARLGPEAVGRFEPVESHLPERATRLVWAGGVGGRRPGHRGTLSPLPCVRCRCSTRPNPSRPSLWLPTARPHGFAGDASRTRSCVPKGLNGSVPNGGAVRVTAPGTTIASRTTRGTVSGSFAPASMARSPSRGGTSMACSHE